MGERPAATFHDLLNWDTVISASVKTEWQVNFLIKEQVWGPMFQPVSLILQKVLGRKGKITSLQSFPSHCPAWITTITLSPTTTPQPLCFEFSQSSEQVKDTFQIVSSPFQLDHEVKSIPTPWIRRLYLANIMVPTCLGTDFLFSSCN